MRKIHFSTITRRAKHALVLASWLPLLIANDAASVALGQEFSAEGTLEVVVRSSPDEATSKTHEFYTEVVGDSYKIRIWESGNEAGYHEYVFSGGLMRILHHVKPRWAGGGPPRGVDQKNPPFLALVERRAVPPTDGSRAQFVWLAYASSHYFAGATNGLTLPIWSPEDPELRRQPFEMLTAFDLAPNPPHPPTRISYVNDGFYRSYNPAKKRLDVIRLRPPYDQGYTNAFYQLLEVTNAGALVLPRTFTFVVYSTPLNAGETPIPRTVARGKTTRVRDTAPEGIRPPEFQGTASVADFTQPGSKVLHGKRVEVPYVAYPITNSSWLSPTQAVATRSNIEAKVQKRLDWQRATDGARSGKAKVIVVCLLFGSFCILLYYARNYLGQGGKRVSART